MRFAMLGPVSIMIGERRHTVSRAQTRGLLSLLMLDVGRTVSRDNAVDALWGGAGPLTARSQVHNAVAVIRAHLARLGAPDAIVSGPAGYRLDVDPAAVDAASFADHTSRSRAAVERGDEEEAVRLLRTALGLWSGEPLADASGAFVEPTRARLVEGRLTAVEELAALELTLGRAELVATEIAPLVDAYPLRERLRVRQMTALYRTGRLVEALQASRDYRRLLVEHEGLDPGPEFVELSEMILRTDPALGRASSGPISTGPASPAAATAAGGGGNGGADGVVPWPVPRMLAPDVADFTGREAEIAYVERLLADPATPSRRPTALAVAAIAGMGGIGKSALGLHVAHRVAEAYPDGQLYVNLRGADAAPLEPGDVLARFLRALGVDSRAVPAQTAERAELYRSQVAGRRMLVLLDNAASEEQVRPLLPGAASCAVLITSRVRLTGVEGARWLDLGVFDSAEAVRLLGQVAGERRVAEEPAEAAEIVRLCGHLPLAVRVAGARLATRRTWRVADLARLLGDERHRLDQLATGDLAVRASVALSYRVLDERSRRLLRLLGLFDLPDFPAWMAAALLGEPADGAGSVDPSGHIEALVDAQLLSIVGTDAAGQSRYRCHDLVRLYARERAGVEESAAARTAALERGLGAWLAVAERMAERVPGPCYAAIHGSAPRPPMDWAGLGVFRADPLVWFETERVALLSAVGQACELGMDEVAFDLAGCLEKYFDIRGMYADWRETNDRVMRVCRAAGNMRGEAVMLRGLIDVLTWQGDRSEGAAMTRLHADALRLLDMFTTLGDERGMSDAAVMLSWGLTARGAYPEAVEAADRGLRLAERSGHLGGRARAHVALAIVHGLRRQMAEVFEHVTRGLADARALGNVRYEATVLQFLGMGYRLTGRLEESLRVLGESLTISRGIRDRYSETLTLVELARSHLARGDPGAARGAAELALELARGYQLGHHAADALGVLGELELADGRPDQAVGHLAESVALWRTRGWPAFLAGALVGLGDAYRDIDVAAARAAWREARELAAKLRQEAVVDRLSRSLDETTDPTRPLTGRDH